MERRYSYRRLGSAMIEVSGFSSQFVDGRGTISNVLTKPVNIALIWSRDGAIRGNHVHKEESHYELVIQGAIEVARLNPNGGVERRVVQPCEMVFTPPGVAHGFRSIGESLILHIVMVPLEGDFYERDTSKVALL